MKMTFAEAGKLGYLASKERFEKEAKERLDTYNKNPTRCKTCNTPIEHKKRKNDFCSHTCAARFNNPLRKGASNNCLVCSTPTENAKYCSHKCGTDHKRILNFKKIEELGLFPASTSRVARAYLTHKYGHKCQLCGRTEWEGKPIPLVADHIDGNPSNQLIENRRMICCNCDALLPTFKGKNRGNGRAFRRQRYAEGKSY